MQTQGKSTFRTLKKLFGVTGDERAERKYFSCPKIVGDNVDLSTANIKINYINANGEKGTYPVTDVTTNGDNVEFSWSLRQSVVAYKGEIRFIVCARIIDETGTITTDWNTAIATGVSSEGIEVDNQAVIDPVKDYVELLEQNLKSYADNTKADVTEYVDGKKTEIDNTVNGTVESVTSEGTKQVNAVRSEGEKQIAGINEAGATNLDKVNEATNGIIADREQIAKNKDDIGQLKKDIVDQQKVSESLKFGIDELRRRTTVDTYDELDDIIDSGNAENYINLGDELLVNRIESFTITSENKELSFSVSDEQLFTMKVGRIDDAVYSLNYANGKWHYLEEEVDLNKLGITVNGTVKENDIINIKMNYTKRSHTFTDFDCTGENAIHPSDKNVKHFTLIEETYVPTTAQYDYVESAVCVTVGHTLKAGKYFIYNVAGAVNDWWCNYKRQYYCFEIPTDITATEETGDIQLRYFKEGERETTGEGKGTYQIMCKPYKCVDGSLYYDNVIQFTGQLTEPSSEYTNFRTIENFTVDQSLTSEGIVYNNLGHVVYGNNDWARSNLRQLINSREKKIKAKRQHKNDVVVRIDGARGNLWGLDPRFLARLKPCIVTQRRPLSDEFKQYELYQCEDVATLLSMYEMSFNFQQDEGQVAKLYGKYTGGKLVNTEIPSRGKADKEGEEPKSYRWSRSADAYDSYYARLVDRSGSNGGSPAVGGRRFAATYILSSPSISTSVEA